MADHIHTIPVLDALREPQGCAFCVMHRKLEASAVQFIMSPAYMEDDVRAETNRLGFCPRHLQAMYDEQNRLGLALMLHTHLITLNKAVAQTAAGKATGGLLSHFTKDPDGPLANMHRFLHTVGGTCYVCNKVESTFDRYMDTYFYLWQKGGDEAKLINGQPGYCLPHFTRVLAVAAGFAKGKREKFMAAILPAQQRMMHELEEDLAWFIFKFDHRNQAEPWKNAKDAVPRGLALLRGTEPPPKTEGKRK